MNAALAIVDKRRESATQTKVMNIIGEVKNRNVVLVDDLISTASSLVEAVQGLKDAGCRDVYAAIVHPVLAGPAIERIRKSALKELVVTYTIPVREDKMLNKIKVLSVASLLCEAIKRIHSEESVSVLFS